jgi:hypothetical protein
MRAGTSVVAALLAELTAGGDPFLDEATNAAPMLTAATKDPSKMAEWRIGGAYEHAVEQVNVPSTLFPLASLLWALVSESSQRVRTENKTQKSRAE